MTSLTARSSLFVLLLLAAFSSSVTGFQPVIVAPSRCSLAPIRTSHFTSTRLFLAEEDKKIESSNKEEKETSDTDEDDKPKEEDLPSATEYQISKEFQKTGLPEDKEESGRKIDAFSIGLGLYLVFVIVDTFIIKITPDENYVTALANGIQGLFGGGGDGN